MTTVLPKNQALTQQAEHHPVLIKGRSPFKVIRPDSWITPDNAETLRHITIKATASTYVGI
jgi:hypothetical protein